MNFAPRQSGVYLIADRRRTGHCGTISTGCSGSDGVIYRQGLSQFAADGARVIFSTAFLSIAHHTAPLRRFGASSFARMVILVVGLAAMTAYTVPDLQHAAGVWLVACLWCCLAYFAVDSIVRARTAIRAGTGRGHILSPSGFIDLACVVAVPIALVCGLPPPTAWLFASLWVLKLAQNSPGFAQIGRVFMLEARPLASVFALFLIVLFLSATVEYLAERGIQPSAFNSMPAALWWAITTLTTTGYGDLVPITPLGRLLGGV